ncbi:MAG TPA: phosphoribosylanthranilate isomerase [Xanthomonadales bacterium]|nr:phosphoribosylanthranilate isomerase [Xanthomonadales bacterium]
MRTRIKLCGMTRREDVLEAVACGADAIGLIFAPRSVRRLDVARAREIADGLPAFVARVALFADQPVDEVSRIVREVPCELLQFHGDEDDAYCRQFGMPFLKALPMASIVDAAHEMARWPHATGFVLDAHARGGSGGSGATFDWSRVPAGDRRVVLAGGLTPGNVREAVARVRPYAVDVASGIEASPGTKDHAKMRAFVAEVRRADAG